MDQTKALPVVIWWIVWIAVIMGLVVVYSVVPPPVEGVAGENALRYVPVFPLVLSGLVRWWVLPRIGERMRAFPLFVVGLALAEGCGVLGMFLVPELRATYLILALLGLMQFMPRFASRFER